MDPKPYLVSWVTDDLEAGTLFVSITPKQADQLFDWMERNEFTDPGVLPIEAMRPFGYDELVEFFPGLAEEAVNA